MSKIRASFAAAMPAVHGIVQFVPTLQLGFHFGSSVLCGCSAGSPACMGVQLFSSLFQYTINANLFMADNIL